MAGLASMSEKELEAYRDEQMGIVNKAKAEFRKAGKVLAKRRGAGEAKAKRALIAKLEAEAEALEGSDG